MRALSDQIDSLTGGPGDSGGPNEPGTAALMEQLEQVTAQLQQTTLSVNHYMASNRTLAEQLAQATAEFQQLKFSANGRAIIASHSKNSAG